MKYVFSFISIVLGSLVACSIFEVEDPHDPSTAPFFIPVKEITVELVREEVTWVYTDHNFNELATDTGVYHLTFTTWDEGTHTIANSNYVSTFDRHITGSHITGSMRVWTELGPDGTRIVTVHADKKITDNNVTRFELDTREIPLVHIDTSGESIIYTFEMRGEPVCDGYLFTSWYEFRTSTQIQMPGNIDPFNCPTDESRCVVRIVSGR